MTTTVVNVRYQPCEVYVGARVAARLQKVYHLPNPSLARALHPKTLKVDKDTRLAAFETLMRLRLGLPVEITDPRVAFCWNDERGRHSPAEWRDWILSLEGKVLGCWCRPARCEADVLIDLIPVSRSLL